MAKRVVVTGTAGAHSVSSWDNSVELSLQEDGSVSVFGYSLRADEQGALHRSRVFGRTGLRKGPDVALAIDEAVEETGCADVWDAGSRADTLLEIEEVCPRLATGSEWPGPTTCRMTRPQIEFVAQVSWSPSTSRDTRAATASKSDR